MNFDTDYKVEKLIGEIVWNILIFIPRLIIRLISNEAVSQTWTMVLTVIRTISGFVGLEELSSFKSLIEQTGVEQEMW